MKEVHIGQPQNKETIDQAEWKTYNMLSDQAAGKREEMTDESMRHSDKHTDA